MNPRTRIQALTNGWFYSSQPKGLLEPKITVLLCLVDVVSFEPLLHDPLYSIYDKPCSAGEPAMVIGATFR